MLWFGSLIKLAVTAGIIDAGLYTLDCTQLAVLHNKFQLSSQECHTLVAGLANHGQNLPQFNVAGLLYNNTRDMDNAIFGTHGTVDNVIVVKTNQKILITTYDQSKTPTERATSATMNLAHLIQSTEVNPHNAP